jgi:hypothetical protein
MNASIRALTGIGLILAIPLFAIPALGASPAHEEGRRIIASRISPKQGRL